MVVGLEKILNTLDKIGKAEGVQKAMETAALKVERSAKQKCPVLTSELRNSIESKVNNNGVEIEGIVFSPLQYAVYVEKGTGLFAAEGNGRTDVPWLYVDAKGKWHITSGQKPQPFLFPALKDNRSDILKLIKGGIING